MNNIEWAEKLYQENYERLFALGFAFVSGNPTQVQKLEDAIQEVFYELIKKSDDLVNHQNINGWLVVTLRLKLKEQYKRVPSSAIAFVLLFAILLIGSTVAYALGFDVIQYVVHWTEELLNITVTTDSSLLLHSIIRWMVCGSRPPRQITCMERIEDPILLLFPAHWFPEENIRHRALRWLR